MARTSFQMTFTDPNTPTRLHTFLQSKGYKYIVENNENVWKCGVGFWTAMKYIKLEYPANNTLVISGWIRPVLAKEMDLQGYAGAIPKKQVMNVIVQMQSMVR